jgi:integrase/recombinase XerD
MPLKLFRRKGSPFWYIRGTVRGTPVFESTGTDSEEAAEAIRIRKESELLDISIHGKKTVATFLEAAVSYLESGGDPRFVGSETKPGKWSGLIGAFGERRLNTIGQIDLDNAARKLYPKASPETRNRQVYTPFIAIWKHAERRQLCDVRRWERPKMTAKPRDRWVTKPEAEKMVANAAPHVAPLVAFLLYTGARMSEALSLRWSDVDLEAGWVVFRETKRKDEDRGVPLHPVALAALTALARSKGHVFLTDDGAPYYDTGKLAGGQVKTAWRGMCKRAKVAGVTPHTMRHSFSTWLTAAGVSERIRDELMGHASTDTGRRYAHVPRDELVAAVAKLPHIKYAIRPYPIRKKPNAKQTEA